jgi:hypothetical protein
MYAEMSLLGSKFDNSCNGYGALFEGYPSGMENSGIWVSIFTVIQMIASLILIVFAIRTIVGSKDEEKIAKLAYRSTIISAIVTFVYMINGFVCVGEMKESLGSYGTVETSAFFPFILALILLGAYFAVTKLPAGAVSQVLAKVQAQGGASETQTLDALVRYKALLDSGVITQEEFEKKKALLLGGAEPSAPVQETAPSPADEESSAESSANE